LVAKKKTPEKCAVLKNYLVLDDSRKSINLFLSKQHYLDNHKTDLRQILKRSFFNVAHYCWVAGLWLFSWNHLILYV